MSGQLRVFRNDAQLFLPGERLLPVGLPPVVKLAGVAVCPLFRHVVRRMHRTRGEVEEERLLRRDLLRIGDEGDRPVGQVFGQVVAFLRRLRWLDTMVVIGEVGIVLVGVTAEKTVVTVEAAAEWPAIVRARCGDLLSRRQVPLTGGIGAVTMLVQYLRQKPVLEGNVAVVAGKPSGYFGDPGHRVRVMIPPGQHACPRRRAKRRCVHVVIDEAVRRERVEVRRVDRAAVATELAKPCVVQDEEQHVGRALFGAEGFRPRGLGLIVRPSDDARKRCPGLVLV